VDLMVMFNCRCNKAATIEESWIKEMTSNNHVAFQDRRRRRELLTTETELMAMAAAAYSGFRRMPPRIEHPAAMGMPMIL